MIQLVITDIDGTIVGKDEILNDEFVRAVKRLREQGVYYTFATGRAEEFTRKYVKQLNLDLPYAACNGSVVMQNGTVLSRSTIPLSKIQTLMQVADEMGMSLLYSINGKEEPYRVTEYVKQQQEQFKRYFSPHQFTKDEWETLEIDKLIVMAKVRDGSLDIIEELCKKMPENIYYKRYANKAIDILHVEGKKENAAQKLADLLHIPMENVLAAGDDLNDLEMLRKAGVGVAVGNALACVKEVADFVATGENYKGVLQALEHFVFEKESL